MVKISTDFESGNIGPWILVNPHELHFHASRNTGMYGMWFYFRLEGAPTGVFNFVVTNMHECLEPQDWVDERPVYRPEGGDWRRVELPPQLNLKDNTFRFCIDMPAQAVEIAFCYPYTLDHLKELLDDLAIGEGVEITRPISSEQGRPVPFVRMACLGNVPHPPTIWALSREHASEVSGGYTLDGFLRALTGSPLRQTHEILALPAAAIDFVSMGHYGKVVAPADYSVSWFADSPRPEIRYVMEQMAEAARTGRTPKMLIRFHSPSPENDSYLVPPHPTVLNRQQRQSICQLAYLLKSETPLTINQASSAKVIGWSAEDAEAGGSVHFVRCYGGIAVGVETSYNAMPDGRMGKPKIWRELGAGIVRAVERHFLEQNEHSLDVYGTLPSVMLDSAGWLLWQPPRGCHTEFSSTQAHLTAWSEKASAFLAAPDTYPVTDLPEFQVSFLPTFETSYHNGGVARILWLPYDTQGRRVFTPPLETTVPSGQSVSIQMPGVYDRRVSHVRPSFHISGTFGDFTVRIGLP